LWVPGSIVEPLPDDDFIAKTEQNLEVVFPEDYREFLKAYSGGDPSYASFLAAGHDWCIDRFLCLLPSGSDDPRGCYDIEMVWGQIDDRLGEDPDGTGTEMVPIAALFAGDMVCLDYREDARNPKLVVWLHEESDYLKPSTRFVANTFTEFLDLIQPHPELGPKYPGPTCPLRGLAVGVSRHLGRWLRATRV